MNRLLALSIGGLALALGSCGSPLREEPPVRDLLEARLATAPDYAHADPQAWNAVREAYRRRGDTLLWLGRDAPRGQVDRLRAAVERAALDGLEPGRYPLPPADDPTLTRAGWAVFKTIAPEPIVAADVKLSFAAARLARDLQRGVAAADHDEGHWRAPANGDDAELLERAAASSDPEAVLRSVAPQHPQYERLRHALERYLTLAAAGGWPTLPPLPKKPKAGADAPEYAALRARLFASGELIEDDGSATLDTTLMDGVKRFQHAHGLPDTGLPDAATAAALDVDVAARIAQIRLNLERWRWLPEDLGDPRIEVNVPTFELRAIENGQPALSMRVVTGKSDTPTPIFSAKLQTLVFSPYWNVPESILRKEIAPELAKDEGYLERKNMELVRRGEPVDSSEFDPDDPTLRVRQKPGADNALGHVKFLFPNEYDVYLHDTPTRLFARSARNFSHGCVRIEKPFELAQWVLAEQPEWSAEKIDAAMNAGEERHVAVKRKVPVYILYETVWVDDDGTVRFAKDLYGHDARQARLLPAVGERDVAAAKVAAQ